MRVQKTLSRIPCGFRHKAFCSRAYLFILLAMIAMCGVGSSYANPNLGFRIRRDNTATSVIRIAFGLETTSLSVRLPLAYGATSLKC